MPVVPPAVVPRQQVGPVVDRPGLPKGPPGLKTLVLEKAGGLQEGIAVGSDEAAGCQGVSDICQQEDPELPESEREGRLGVAGGKEALLGADWKVTSFA